MKCNNSITPRRRRVLLVVCAAALPFLPQASAQESQRIRRPDTVPAVPSAAARRVVIAPPSAALSDPASVLRAVLPHTTPPPRIAVVTRNGAVEVEGLDWAPSGPAGSPADFQVCKCQKELHICPPVPCSDCCRIIIRKPDPAPDARQPSGDEVDQMLARAGLKRAAGQRRPYALDLVLFGSAPQPEQYISCMEKDKQGNCTHWRICGTTNSGVYRCYDVVKDPVFGWVVTWE